MPSGPLQPSLMSAQTTQLGCSPHDPSHNSSERGKPPGSFSELPQPFQKLPRPQHRSRLLAAGSQRGMWRANRLRIQKLYDNLSKINRSRNPAALGGVRKAKRCSSGDGSPASALQSPDCGEGSPGAEEGDWGDHNLLQRASTQASIREASVKPPPDCPHRAPNGQHHLSPAHFFPPLL